MDKVQAVLDRSITHITRAPLVAEKNGRAVKNAVHLMNIAVASSEDPRVITILLEAIAMLEGSFEESTEVMRDLVKDLGEMTTAYRDEFQDLLDKIQEAQTLTK